MAPVEFVKIQDDGALVFKFLRKYEQVVYPENFKLPSKDGKNCKILEKTCLPNDKECCKQHFLKYTRVVDSIIRSSADGKFVITFKKKFPKKTGEIFYYDEFGSYNPIFLQLSKSGILFE